MSRIYRFFAEELKNQDLEKDVSLNPRCEADIFNQLTRVLRIKAGDKIVLVGENGFEFSYETVSAHKKNVELKFLNKNKNENEPGFNLGLILCLPNKPDKLAMILQKAVELGVSEVILVNGDFSRMKHDLKEERLMKIMKEAAEQSERALIPQLLIKGSLVDLLESDWGIKESASIYVAMERAENKSLFEVLRNNLGKCAGENENGTGNSGSGGRGDSESIYILVGPEGGFSENEKLLIEQKGLKTFTLGKRILRMETAAIVSLGIAACDK